MQNYKIVIEVKALSSGAALDWLIRQTMSETDYCDIQEVSIFDENGNDVTHEEEIYPDYEDDHHHFKSQTKITLHN